MSSRPWRSRLARRCFCPLPRVERGVLDAPPDGGPRGPASAFPAHYSSPEGLFYAKLSAASTMAIAPILILAWFRQKQLVRGLTFGAVNESLNAAKR